MLSLSNAEAARHAARVSDAPHAAIIRRHSEELTRSSGTFGDVHAELFSCRSDGFNELEVLADSHTLLLRCDGTASQCEIAWPDNEQRQKLAELRPGSIVFSPASSTVRVRKRDRGDYRYISVHIPPTSLDQLRDDEHDPARLVLSPQAGPAHGELCRVMFAMRDEIEAPGPAGTLYKETLALQLLIQLVRCTCQLTILPAKGGLAGWRLRRAIGLLEADLTRTLSIGQLADEVGLSPAHFCTAFRESTGHSPHRYLRHRRLAHAKQLMRDAHLSLTEIALSCGFASSSQFATTFRRINGVTPSAYRRGL